MEGHEERQPEYDDHEEYDDGHDTDHAYKPGNVLLHQQQYGDEPRDELLEEGEPASTSHVSTQDSLRALGGALTQELASAVVERQQAAEIARQHQHCRKRVVDLERDLAEEQEREAARPASVPESTPRRRKSRPAELPPSQAARELERAQDQLVQSVKFLEKRYTDSSVLSTRAERSARGLRAAQSHLAAQLEAVSRLEQTVLNQGKELVRLRHGAREQEAAMRQQVHQQEDAMQHAVGTHQAEMQSMRSHAADEITRISQEAEAEKQRVTEWTEAERQRMTEWTAAETQRVTEETAAEVQRANAATVAETQRVQAETQLVTEETAADAQRITEEASAYAERIKADAIAEAERVRADTASEITRVREDTTAQVRRIKEGAASEIMRMTEQAAAERRRMIQTHGQLLQAARAEARADALQEATRAIELSKAEAERESRLAAAAVAEASAAAEEAMAQAERSRKVLAARSTGAAAEEYSGQYEETLETLSTTLLSLRKANSNLVASEAGSERRAQTAEQALASLEVGAKRSQTECEDAQAEAQALRTGRVALKSELGITGGRLDAVVQANHVACGLLLTAEHSLVVGDDGRPALLKQLERAARILLAETENRLLVLAKGIETLYLAFASGDPALAKLKRLADVAAARSLAAGINPSTEAGALRSALVKVCSCTGDSLPTALQQQLQDDCGLTTGDCASMIDRLVDYTVQEATKGGPAAGEESLFKHFLRYGWEHLIETQKRQSLSHKFGIKANEAVMVAEGQQAWAKRTVVLKEDCIMFFGEREFEELGKGPRSRITLRTALIGQLVQIPSATQPMGAEELAFSVAAGDKLFWVRASDQELTRQLHITCFTSQRGAAQAAE